ncbi:MAG: GyrI-like domain-containing protein [Planctomycetota bacterium]
MKMDVVELERTPVLGVKVDVKQSEIGHRIGELLPQLMKVAGSQAAGAPLARWHAWKDDVGTMELAVPVKRALPATGRFQPDALPGGKAIVTWHVGPYDDLHVTWKALREAMKERGLEGRAEPWEEYVSDCSSVPADQVRTRIVWPIR